MAWMIGIDEAGYGPNLGPLAVAASAWWVEEEGKTEGGRRRGEGHSSNTAVLAAVGKPRSATCLYRRLKKIVSRSACEKKLAIADSKQLYKPGLGLRQLERGVLVGLRAVGEPSADKRRPLLRNGARSVPAPGEKSEAKTGGINPPARWGAIISRHAPTLPCYADFDCELPIDATADEVDVLASRFDVGCQSAGVKLVDLRVRLVYPREFNELTNHFGTKGAALSHISIGLLRATMDGIAEHSPDLRPGLACGSGLACGVQVVCDKHGGRNRYAALLQHHFPEQWIDTLAESGPASRYAWGPSESRVEVCFRVKGEAELPVALASMTAKYHRELAMRAFNHFWCGRVPGLRPTAGYPGDSKRFKVAITPLQNEMGIEDDCLWRWR